MAAGKNTSLALSLAAIVVGMVLLAYASVPLYRLFCQVTGFGGIAEQTKLAQPATGTRLITVRFDANVAPGLDWSFKAPKPVTVKVGAKTVVYYVAQNRSAHVANGRATFNVTPTKAGQYFHKVHCFCFDKQVLKPGKKDRMGVTFFIDPAINDDPAASDIHTITLSYTFFPLEK